MSIRKHRDGKWLIDVTVDGKRKTAVLPEDTHKDDLELAETRLKLELLEARAAEAQTELEQKSGRGWTFEAGYRNSLRVRTTWQSESQRKVVGKQWGVISKYLSGSTLLAEIDTERLDEFIQEVIEDRGVSGSTINRYLSFISAICTDAVNRKKLSRVPHMPRQAEGQCRIRWFTDEEEALFMARALEMEYREVADATAVFIDSGMRMGELWTLQSCNIDFEAGMLVLDAKNTKTNRGRALPLTDRMAAVLRPRAASGGLVFPEFSSDGFYRRFMRVVHSLGLEGVIPYTCRHTCCTRLVRRGVPLFAVAEHMGHTNLQTTRRYAHFAPQDKDAIKQVLQGATWAAAVVQQGMISQ